MKEKRKLLENISYNWSEDSIRLINTPSQAAKAVFYYVQEVGYFKAFPGYYTERENLNSFLIVYTIAGEGRLRYEGAEYRAGAGQCFYINCMKHHYYTSGTEEEWEFLWVHFQGSSALGYYEQFAGGGFRVIDVEEPFLFDSGLRRLLAIHQKKTVTTEITASRILVTLLSELLIQNCIKQTGKFVLPKPVKKAAAYIERNFMQQLTLDEIAAEVGMDKYYLAKEYKKHIGMPVHESVIIARISKAKELLKYSDQTVEEITYACGMNHVSHFINLFKEREGTTPLGYRKEWRKT